MTADELRQIEEELEMICLERNQVGKAMHWALTAISEAIFVQELNEAFADYGQFYVMANKHLIECTLEQSPQVTEEKK